jgi:hypothetical protein
MMSNALTGVTMAQDGSDAQGAAIAVALMGLCGFAFVLTRANTVRRTFATSKHMADASLELVKSVARAQRKRAAVFAAVCVAAVLVVSGLPLPIEARAALAVPATLLLGISLVAICRLQLLLGLAPEPSLRVRSHGHHLFVSRGKRLVGWVAAPPRLVARASGLPVATVRHS